MTAQTPEPHGPRSQFAVVVVREQDRSLRFYLDKLGFRLVADETVPHGGRWVVVEPPDRSVRLALVTPPENSDASKNDPVEFIRRHRGKRNACRG